MVGACVRLLLLLDLASCPLYSFTCHQANRHSSTSIALDSYLPSTTQRNEENHRAEQVSPSLPITPGGCDRAGGGERMRSDKGEAGAGVRGMWLHKKEDGRGRAAPAHKRKSTQKRH